MRASLTPTCPDKRHFLSLKASQSAGFTKIGPQVFLPSTPLAKIHSPRSTRKDPLAKIASQKSPSEDRPAKSFSHSSFRMALLAWLLSRSSLIEENLEKILPPKTLASSAAGTRPRVRLESIYQES